MTDFHLGDLLSITTGVLLSPDRIDGVYRIVDYVTGTSHMPHQLPRAANEIKPYLLEEHPWLAAIETPELVGEDAYTEWMSSVAREYGERHEVTPMPAGTYVPHDPIAELREMAPNMQIMVVALPESLNDAPASGESS